MIMAIHVTGALQGNIDYYDTEVDALASIERAINSGREEWDNYIVVDGEELTIGVSINFTRESGDNA